MRKREAIRFLRKVKQEIQEGHVVPDPHYLYSDKEGTRFYSKSAVLAATDKPCGCLIGLWYLISGENQYSVNGFKQYIGPVLPRKNKKDKYNMLESFISKATAVTAKGPKAMLKVVNKALKRLEA